MRAAAGDPKQLSMAWKGPVPLDRVIEIAVRLDVVLHRADPEVALSVGPAVVQTRDRVIVKMESDIPAHIGSGPPLGEPACLGEKQLTRRLGQGDCDDRLIEDPGFHRG
jgi:hypothetical protein